MPDNRYYLDDPLEQSSQVSLEDDEWHHLSRVMRAKIGDEVELVNGRGRLAIASLTEKNLLEIRQTREEPPPARTLILAQALPLPNHLEWIIEKGTELGASAFWLFPGDRSEKKGLSDNQKRRLHLLTLAALKQCGRLYLPPILEKPPLSKWEAVQGAFFGDPRSTTAPTSLPKEGVFTLFIGPEAGFSPKEEELLRHQFNATGVRFNPHILRAETAAICALSIFNCPN